MTNKGLTYLSDERRLKPETIDKFSLAYCDERGIRSFGSHASPIGCSELNKVYLDPAKFNNSILFPIFNVYGGYVGISARSLDPNNELKYVNTVYPKGKHLYGFNVTWPECLRERKVYIVEGNVDAIMMYQCGIKNVVGMVGSTVGITQLTLLLRFVDHIVFVPDGDKAGKKFIQRVIVGKPGQKSLIEKHPSLGLTFSTINLADKYDPDTFLKEFKIKDLRKLEQPVQSDLPTQYRHIIGGMTEV